MRVGYQHDAQSVADVLVGTEAVLRDDDAVSEIPAECEVCRRYHEGGCSRDIALGLFPAQLMYNSGDDVADQPYDKEVYHYDRDRPAVDEHSRGADRRGYDCREQPREEAVFLAELFYRAESVKSADNVYCARYREQQYRAEYCQPHIIPR